MRTEWVSQRLNDPIRTQIHYARKGVITEEEADRAFGPPILNRASELYREQLQDYRRLRMGVEQ